MIFDLKRILPIYCLMALNLFYGQENTQKSGNKDNYRLVEDWPRSPSDSVMGQPSGLGVDTHGDLIVFHRAGAASGSDASILIPRNTIVKLEAKTGKVLDAWGADLFSCPHGLNVDPDDNIWVTDVGLHQILSLIHI